MRALLFAAVLATACSGGTSKPPVAPAGNHVDDPAAAAAKDPLAFLPVDSDIVVALDLKNFRASALWNDFQPLVTNALDDASNPAYKNCVAGVVGTMGQAALGLKLAGETSSGVIVVHGIDAPTTLNCLERELRTQQVVETVDRGVVIGKTEKGRYALGAAGPSTIVAELDQVANHDSFAKLLAAGSPLRTSQAFLGLYDHLERGASLWTVMNGNSKPFEQLAAMGMKARSVDGTIVVTDKITLAGRMTVESPEMATNIANMATPQLAQAKSMFERLDVSAAGPVVRLDAVMTAPQLKMLLAMVGIHGK